jgi:hypothetical protein
MRNQGTRHDRTSADFERTVLGECPPGYDPSQTSGPVEARVAEMRALLARMRPASDAEALQALRNAFPEVALSTRVAAIAARHV